ncbi:MAG: hypothetical protein LBD30_02430, partial [Verrucomicrobiales bacterium]|nr:hypothetical protein [Verrucomicrobiales bacterium]
EIDAQKLNAYSRDGNLNLAAPGDLTVHELHALNGYVSVSAGGAINDDGDPLTLIKARDLILSAATGIGNTAPLNTQVQTLDAVTVSGAVNFAQQDTLLVKRAVTGDGDITIAIINGSLNAENIAATGAGNTVTLSVPNGAINNARTDGGVTVSGDRLVLVSGSGIGAKGKYLDIATGLITAEGGTGGIYLHNHRAGLQLAGLDTRAGDIALITPGALTISDPLINSGGGDIYLTTTDTGVDTDYIIVNGSIQARGGNGSIYLNPDDSLFQNATISVEGSGNVIVSAGLDIIMDPVTGITIADTGLIDYTAGRELSLGQLIASLRRPNGGSVTVTAPRITVSPADTTPILADFIRINTGANGMDLVNSLIAGRDFSSGIWLNGRRVGGLHSRDTTYTWQPRLDYVTYDLGWHHLYRDNYEVIAASHHAWSGGYFKTHEEDGDVWIFNHINPRQ